MVINFFFNIYEILHFLPFQIPPVWGISTKRKVWKQELKFPNYTNQSEKIKYIIPCNLFYEMCNKTSII